MRIALNPFDGLRLPAVEALDLSGEIKQRNHRFAAAVIAGRKGWPLAGLGKPLSIPRGRVVELSSDRFASYAEIYREQLWVHVAVNKLARMAGRLPWKAYQRVGEEHRVPDTGSLSRLLRSPHPGGTGFRLKEATVGSLYVYGNALWVMVRPPAGGPPVEVWPVPWWRVTVSGGGSAPIEYYDVKGSSGSRRYLPSDVVHFRWWSPDGELGVSPCEPLRQALMLEDHAVTAAQSHFSTGLQTPGGLRTTDGRHLSDEDRKTLRNEIDSMYSGSGNAGRPMLLEGLEWVDMSRSARDSQLIEHRHLTRDEVAAAFDIPPPAIHILDRATFSNVTEQHRMLYMDTMGPPLALLEETVQAQLIDPEPSWSGLYTEFLLADVLKGATTERSEAYQRFQQASVYTPNELRRMENLPPIPDARADAIYTPVNMVAVHPDVPGQPAHEPNPTVVGDAGGDSGDS